MSEEIMEMETVNDVEVVETDLTEDKGGFGIKDVVTVLGIAGAGYVAGTYIKKGVTWAGNALKTKVTKLKEKKAAEKTEEPETEDKESKEN